MIHAAQWLDVLIGGNHLASFLIGKLGGDFAVRFPPTMPVEQAVEAIDDTDVLDVWICWSAIMRARGET
jgi:hypothetical protein